MRVFCCVQTGARETPQAIRLKGVTAMGCAPTTCLDAGSRPDCGEGVPRETVLLLHGSAGTGAIWRNTCGALRALFRCVAPDLIGYGSSEEWPAGIPFDLDAETRRIEPLLLCCDDRFHVVGYSYGGVLALHLALENPARVRTLALIEPVFFAALRYAGEWQALDRFARVRDDFLSALAAGEREAAMRRFIHFWVGEGAWSGLPAQARAEMLRTSGKIALDWRASFAADPGADKLRALGARTMLVRGDRSPEPMLRLVDALHAQMPGSSCVVVAGANHLLPITHPAAVTGALLSHLNADAERRLR